MNAELNRPRRQASATLALLLYLAEIAALLTILAIYKLGSWPLATFLRTPAGAALVTAPPIFFAAVTIIIRVLRKHPEKVTAFWPAVGLNLWSLVLMAGTAEVALRVFATGTPLGPQVANVTLIPRDWSAVAQRNQALLARVANGQSYLVFDSLLGWTVGRDRKSSDYNRSFQERYIAEHENSAERTRLQQYRPGQDIYASSIEGLRSPRQGFSFAAQPAQRRIALLGDSFTFGLEVGYEQTWGYELEKLLGREFQVLNFGVDGYGVDQAFLRYRRDAAPWHPEVVILGVISDDLRRTMCVYGFLCFPASEIPFPKPRFVLDADTLALLNRPLPRPESLFASKSLAELPFVDLDPAFDPIQWEKHFYHRSFAVRFVLSRFPRWQVPAPAVSDDALRAVNAELIRQFVRTVKDAGSTPVVVYFPSSGAFVGDGATAARGREVLRSSGVPLIDLTECVTKVPPAERFVILHYSPATNAEIARCLMESLGPIVAGN